MVRLVVSIFKNPIKRDIIFIVREKEVFLLL